MCGEGFYAQMCEICTFCVRFTRGFGRRFSKITGRMCVFLFAEMCEICTFYVRFLAETGDHM